jgi:monoamine oxidase
VDVVVIGAGVGGLAATRALVDAGREVVVLEARDRVGGRLLSVAAGEAGIDLGATWFWANEPRVRALVSTLGLAVHDQHIEGDALYQDFRGVHRLAGNPVEGPAFRLTAGMQELARAMARGLPGETVRLNHPVSRIRSMPEGVEVDAPRTTFRASAVVVGVPPALAVERIAFEPDLPDDTRRIASITPVWMGAMTKVVIRYERPFWRGAGLAGAVMSHVGPMREIHDMCGPGGQPAALFGFVPSTEPGAPTVGTDVVLAQLRVLFGASAPDPTGVLIHDWRTEAHTSPSNVARLQAYETYGHPVYQHAALDGRLHWASTETAREVPGHVEGALAAGARAAAAILA